MFDLKDNSFVEYSDQILSQMADGEGGQRLFALIDKCFEKLAKYNYLIDQLQQDYSGDAGVGGGDEEAAEPIEQIQSPPLPTIPLPGTISQTANARPTSYTPDGNSTFRSSIFSSNTAFGLSSSSRRQPSENLTRRQVRERGILLRRRYQYHFSSLETFFYAYISKLEKKYIQDPFPTTTTPEGIIGQFDQFSHTVLALDGIYWRTAHLREHIFIKRGGKWYKEGISRILDRTSAYIATYERVIQDAPEGVNKVVLMPLKDRKLKKRWWMKKKLFMCWKCRG